MVHLKKSTKTISETNIKRDWHLINIDGKILGRSLPRIAELLQGKHKPHYSAHIDCGDNVVVINASKIILTGKKKETKMYQRFSGYPGGLRKEKVSVLLTKNPSYIIISGVSGMLPKNKLRDKRLARLFVFSDANHTYQEELKGKS